jgi:hypothetical protein
MDIANDVTYKHAKSQYEILWIVVYKKWQNRINLEILKYTYPDPRVCHFCLAQNTNYLKFIFCKFVG